MKIRRVLALSSCVALGCLLLAGLSAHNSSFAALTSQPPSMREDDAEKQPTWPRDRYTGPGGGLYTGPDGGLYEGPGGGAYEGPGGGLYSGPGGGMYTGPEGGLYEGPGGGLYQGPGGGLYAGPGGGLYTGPGGGLYAGPGGGLYTGACDHPYRSNQPPRDALLKYLKQNKRKDLLKLLHDAGY